MPLTQPMDDYDSIIREFIWGNSVLDQYGRNSVALSMATEPGGMMKEWAGGDTVTEPFAYRAAPAQNVGIGGTWNYDEQSFMTSSRFGPRYTRSGLADYLERIAITYNDLGAKYNYLDLKCQHIIDGVGLHQAVQLYKDGQAVAPTTGSPSTAVDDRTLCMNGFDEAMNDGVVPGWQGKIFIVYLGVTRSTYGRTQSSTPRYLNTIDGKPGPISWQAMFNRVESLTRKGRRPTVVLTSRAGLSQMMGMVYERARVINEGVMGAKPYWGPTGLKFLDGAILADELCPSAEYGDELTIPGESYQTTHFTCPNSMPASSGLSDKAGVTIYVGEPAFFICEERWSYFQSNHPYYSVGLTPFQKAWGSNLVASDVNALSTEVCHDPTTSGLLLGFGSATILN